MTVSSNPSAASPTAVSAENMPFLGKFFIILLSILVWIGLGAGVFIGVYALSASYSLTIYLTIVLGFLAGIAFAISLWGKTGSMRRALAMDVFLIVSGVILIFAFTQGLRPAGPGVFLCVMAVIILIVILMAWRRPLSLDWLIELYNPEKAFGGATFGEFTGFIGVVGALGAHAALASDAEGWYWMGHFGTLLAFAAGASLFWRWLRFEDDPVPAYISLLGVFFTLLSLALAPDLANWYEGIVWGLFIILGGAALIMVCISSKNLRRKNKWGKPPHASIDGAQRVWLIIFTVLICLAGGSIIVLFLFSRIPVSLGDTTFGAMALNIAALLCWVAAEGWNVYQKSKEPWKVASNYQEWEKNIWNIFGASTLIFFTLSPLWTGEPIPPESTYIFMLGIVFGLLGTLRGIMLGMIKKYG